MNRTWWRAYQTVNERYAEAVARIAPLNGLVWVHDYHLLLTPAMIRARRPDLRIGLFLHIPFPSVDLFATLPWRGDLVRGMSNADLLGFQTEHDSANAAAAIRQFAGDRRPSSRIREVGAAEIGTFPISIDVEHWETLGEQAAAGAARRRAELGVEFVFAGVDRLDYTKGIDQRLRAFRELLDQGLLDPRTCSLRPGLGAQQGGDLRLWRAARRGRLAGRRHQRAPQPGRPRSGPSHHVAARRGRPERVVSSSRLPRGHVVRRRHEPGREGVRCQRVAISARRVVLSEFAGAAQAMPGALIVNPFDIDAVKQAMLRARRMPAAERASRMSEMRDGGASEPTCTRGPARSSAASAGRACAASAGPSTRVAAPAAGLRVTPGTP